MQTTLSIGSVSTVKPAVPAAPVAAVVPAFKLVQLTLPFGLVEGTPGKKTGKSAVTVK